MDLYGREFEHENITCLRLELNLFNDQFVIRAISGQASTGLQHYNKNSQRAIDTHKINRYLEMIVKLGAYSQVGTTTKRNTT